MFPRAAAALIPLAGLASAAQAQFTPDSTVSYSLSWLESDANGLPAGNGNGLLEPGEHALLSLTASFTNQNIIATFSPPMGTFTSGTIRGFGQGIMDLVGANQAEGLWNLDNNIGLGVRFPFDIAGPLGSGTPAAGGARVVNIQLGQVPWLGSNTSNPVLDIWTGVWTPASFTSRTVSFTTERGSVVSGPSPYSAVIIRLSTSVWALAWVGSVNGSVQIPIIPAPPTMPVLTLLAAAAILTPRRPSAPSPPSAPTGTPPPPSAPAATRR